MLHDNLSIPIALTLAPLMSLRSENLLAFELANVPISTLLHPDTLPAAPSDLSLQGAHFALVDHNKLHPAFSGGIVDAVIDHHDDEGQYMDARVRLLQVPTGSCASLVTRHFKASWQASLSSPAGNMGSPVPPELATLLLSAILIDTAGLKQGGKATATDYDSAAFLYPISSFGVEDTSASLSPSSTPPKLDQVAQRLLTAKFDVSHLSTHDLLLRDYKGYTLPTSSSSYPTLRVGLSTVPQSLKTSLEKEASGWTSYLEGVDGYMAEREVDIEGVLTTYTTEGKAKHKREILLIVRSGGAIDSTGMATAVLACLSEGLEASTELALGPWERKEFKRSIGSRDVLNSEARVGRVWEQGNTKATRKQAAPLLVSCPGTPCRIDADDRTPAGLDSEAPINIASFLVALRLMTTCFCPVGSLAFSRAVLPPITTTTQYRRRCEAEVQAPVQLSQSFSILREEQPTIDRPPCLPTYR